MPKKLSTYSRARGLFCQPAIVSYSKTIENKICSHFPVQYREAAVEKTRECVSTLIGSLGSKLVQKNINRNDSLSTISQFLSELQSVEKSLLYLLDNPSHHSADKIRRSLYKVSGARHAEDSLRSLKIILSSTISACKQALTVKDAPGIRNPHYYTAILRLAKVWKKYTGKRPTLHYIGKSNEPGGPFLKYLQLAINTAIHSHNSSGAEGLRKIPMRAVSIYSIARDVIRDQDL